MMKMLATYLGVMLVGAVAASPAMAQPKTVTEIATYKGDDRQSLLEAGAREEGELLVYTTGTQIKPLVDQFMEKYPFIKVELARASSADVARKVVEEYNAEYNKVDAFELAASGLIVPRDMKILQPFYSPEAAAYDPEAVEPGQYWIVARESYIGIGYNTDIIPEAKAPKTYKDLLSPEWRGKLAVSGSTSTSANWVGTLVILYGEDFVRQLGRQNMHVHKITGRAMANLMISGEIAISPTIYNSHVNESRAKGAPLAWVAPGPVPVTDTGVAIASAAPHPHAAMLFIDFALSKEGQKLYAGLGYDSARQDMNTDKAPVKKIYLSNRPNYVQEFEHWVKLYQDVILRGGGGRL